MTTKDLTWGAREVGYEIEMFRAAVRSLSQMPDDEVSNLVAEALLLHLRNLINFFYPPSDDPRDIVAEDFVPEWHELRPGGGSADLGRFTVRELRLELNRRLAHVSWARPAKYPGQNFWDIRAVDLALEDVIAVFTAAVSAETRTALTYRYPVPVAEDND